jgi:hypothetical protein
VNHPQSISGIELIWNKALGCYCEFGVKETLRRIAKEILRPARASVNGLDISIITERLAIGASPKSPEALRQILNLGFRHIIDLRAERKRSDILVDTENIPVSWIPTYDNWKPKPDEFFRTLMKDVNYFLSSVDNEKLFICCGAGEHRAPLAGVLALVMMGYPLDTAIMMIQKARPVAELLPVYISSLKQFLESTNQDSRNGFVGSIG